MKRIFALIICAITLFGCDDMPDMLRVGTESTGETSASEILILCEGLFNMNNSTLARYIFESDSLQLSYFQTTNKRGLGDTANDMKRYGSRIYITVSTSSQLEIIHAQTGMSVKQIPLFNENGIARQPRYVAFDKGKVYVSCFDGYVARIDTTTLEIEAYAKCGKNPDGICIANGKIYVSNSGGLDFPNYDKTVSVLGIDNFKEIKKIDAFINPGQLHTDSQGDVYLVTRGDYDGEDYCLHKIDSKTDNLVKSFTDIKALNMTIHNDTAYIYNYDFNTKEYWIKLFDCKTERIIKDKFITDETKMQTPYGIQINQSNGDVFITEAYDFVTAGDVLCFDRNGKLRYRLNEVGLNPNRIIVQ